MAKRVKVAGDTMKGKDDPRRSTTTAADTSEVRTRGLGLKSNEWDALEDIGADFGLTRHGMAAYAVRYFLAKYRAGEIELESKPRLPGL